MAALAWLALAAVASQQAALRSTGCGGDDAVVATLPAGAPLEIRFSLGGTCYKVSANVEGGKVEGYLPASAIRGLEEFEQGRREAKESRVQMIAGAQAEVPDVRKLAALGMEAYREDDVGRALYYWKKALDQQPDPTLARLYHKARREAESDLSREKKFGTRFVLRYDGAIVDAETARTLVAMLEQEFSRVSFELGCPAEERITAVVQTRDAYLRSTDAAEWSSGLYDGRIRVAVPGKAVDEQARRTLVHEMVHACLATMGNYPAWLHEGLAQKLSGETLPAAAWQQVRRALRENNMPRLGRLGQDWARLSPQHAALAYAQALAAVETYYQTQSALGIRNLLKSKDLIARMEVELDAALRR